MENFETDIPIGTAIAAFNGTSFDPEKRGEQARAEYASTLNNDYNRLAEGLSNDMLSVLDDEFERYREGYRARYLKWLHARSRCMSTMITGGSGFPVRRMEKINNVERKRSDELTEYRSRALTAIKKVIHPELRPIMSGDDDATQRLQVKIDEAEKLQTTMREANRVIRSKKDEAAKISALAELGISEYQARELFKPDFCGRIGFADYQLSNNNANIRRMKERLAQISKAQATPETSHKGVNAILEDCPSENRIRLTFPGKPSEEVRSRLKHNGFRWTPSLGVWQAYRNHHSMVTAKEIAGEVAR